MNRPACKTDIWILPQGTLTLGRSLRGRVNGLANMSKMIFNGLALRSSSNTTTSQSYSTG